eukprot:714075-Rhodomonas_salina.1
MVHGDDDDDGGGVRQRWLFGCRWQRRRRQGGGIEKGEGAERGGGEQGYGTVNEYEKKLIADMLPDLIAQVGAPTAGPSV